MPAPQDSEGNEVKCDAANPTSLFVFKTSIEEHIGEINYFKVMAGEVTEGMDLINNTTSTKERLSQLMRFAFAYNFIYSPALVGTWSKIKKYDNENWFKRLIYNQTYNDAEKQCDIGHENNQEIILAMKEYTQDILIWLTDLHNSSTSNTDQKMELIVDDFYSEFNPKNNPNRVTLKDKLNSSQKNKFSELINDGSNMKLLNVMSNICYKKINKDQKGLSVFMDVLFKSCER